MITRYAKKSEIVEAIKYDGNNLEEIRELFGKAINPANAPDIGNYVVRSRDKLLRYVDHDTFGQFYEEINILEQEYQDIYNGEYRLTHTDIIHISGGSKATIITPYYLTFEDLNRIILYYSYKINYYQYLQNILGQTTYKTINIENGETK